MREDTGRRKGKNFIILPHHIQERRGVGWKVIRQTDVGRKGVGWRGEE